MAEAGPDDALLVEGDGPAPDGVPVERFRVRAFVFGPAGPHRIGCACCTPRVPVADALARLFLARARGDSGFFQSVLAVPLGAAGAAAIRAALDSDQMAASRFRLLDGAGAASGPWR
jgi:hypothetical protein